MPACTEGALQIVDGKAKLVSENLCDGLGACLGNCPEGALTVEERPAEEFDESAVVQHQTSGTAASAMPLTQVHLPSASERPTSPQRHGGTTMTAAQTHALEHATGACPGARMMNFARPETDTVDDTSIKWIASFAAPPMAHPASPRQPRGAVLRGRRRTTGR